MASELEEYIDMIAERVTALGGLALGTIRMAVSSSTLPEYPTDIFVGQDHVTALADRYGAYAKSLRDAIASTDELGDADTADLYTEISRDIDKRLWFLEAHLYPESAVSVNAATSEVAATVEKDKKASGKRK
jgi:starvation-inducible DNA-binding protein